MNLRSEPTRGFMSEETLEILVKKTLQQVSHTATFAFQGGEPTLAGLPFYRHLIELEKKYNTNGIAVHNSIQTNGIVLNEEWAQFLHDNHFLVGLSWTVMRSFTMKTGSSRTEPEAFPVCWKRPGFWNGIRWTSTS